MARAKSTIGRNPLAAVTPAPEPSATTTPPEIAPEVVPGVVHQVIPEIAAENAPDVVHEVAPEIAPEIAPEVVHLIAAEPGAEPGPGAGPGAGTETLIAANAQADVIHTACFVPAALEGTPDDAPSSEAVLPPGRRRDAMRLVRRHMAMSAAAGVLPLPAVDVAAAVGVQVNLLRALSRLYAVKFDATLARQLVLALLGGGGSVLLALPAASAMKAVPVVGNAASLLLSPTFATLSCYGTGQAFVRHFEAGGTLENFIPATDAEPVAA